MRITSRYFTERFPSSFCVIISLKLIRLDLCRKAAQILTNIFSIIGKYLKKSLLVSFFCRTFVVYKERYKSLMNEQFCLGFNILLQ